jgi:hypothetical protein
MRNVNTLESTTVANADLWTRYFQDEWNRWLNPRAESGAPVSQVAEGTAARVAGFLTLVAAGPIAWLYSANAPQVTRIEPAPEAPAFEATPELMESVEEASAA